MAVKAVVPFPHSFMSIKIDRGKGERHAIPIPKEKLMVTRKIRMLSTHQGSPDGINVNEYEVGKTYDLPPRLAEIFLDAEWAEEDRALDGPEETKIDTPEDIQKAQEKAARKKAANKKRAAKRKAVREKKAAAKLAAEESAKE